MKRWMLAVVAVMVVVSMPATGFAQAKTSAAQKSGAMSAKRATGTVKMVAADSLTVSGAGGKEMMFAVDSSTKVVAKGASTKSAAQGGKLMITDAVKAGDHVTVSYHEMDGKMHAAEVRVTAKGSTK
jgi:hypothetical protein